MTKMNNMKNKNKMNHTNKKMITKEKDKAFIVWIEQPKDNMDSICLVNKFKEVFG